ncbi:hypothetical protein B1B_03648, partial [mine drainage metagenome]
MTQYPQDQYVVLFGGIDGSTIFGDTWTYAAGVWTNLSLTVHPQPGWGASAVFDPLNDVTILFGGCSQP